MHLWHRIKHASRLICVLAGAPLSAAGHHSFAPHFDASRAVVISGVVSEYEQRNPHAYLHVMAEDASGRTREYVCESHGVTQLTRNGITPELLQPGTVVTLTGSQARRDPYMCFFNTVEFTDGSVLNVNGSRGARPGAAADSGADVRADTVRGDIFGTWLLVPANRSTSGPQPMIDFLTPAGLAATQQYDPFLDDPTFRCDPVAIRRVWFAPGTPLSISRDENRIVIRHEWMDAQRVIHLDREAAPENVPRTSLGYSVGRFDGDTLIIETTGFAQGVLRQYVETQGEQTRGLLHSEDLTTIERLRFDAESNRLQMEIEHYDPTFFTRDFPLSSAQYAPSDLALQPFNCRPENPDHTLQ